MLRPDELLHISEGAEEISEVLHNEIVKRIVERIVLRIGRGDNYILTAQDKWQLETLQQAGYLLEDIQKEIAKVTKLQQDEIAEAMEDAGVKTLEYDAELYQSAGISTTPLHQSPELIRIAQRNYEATMGEFTNFTRTMASQSQQLFINECDRAYMLVASGTMSYTEVVKEVVNSIVSNGVKVTYDTGRSDTIETATLRAVRTGISQMSAQIQLKRMEENEVDRILISSHLGARPSHHLWQGKVFTVEEMRSTNEGMPAYGTATGLCGINCRHSFGPYFDFMDNPYENYDSEENRKQYEKEQRQRTLERRIRDTKRQVMGMKTAVDGCSDPKAKFELDLQYQKKAVLLAKQNEAYKEYCADNNLRPLSDRIQIAKWDRQQAAAARGAAKRYEIAHDIGNQGDTKRIIKDIINKINDHAPVGINELPENHVIYINSVINSAPQLIKEFTLKNIENVKIINEKYVGMPITTRKGIKFDVKKQKEDARGKYTSFFHEVGHSIDSIAGDISVSNLFKTALQNDFENVVKSYMKYYNVSKSEAFSEISENLNEEKTHIVSDLFGALSENKCVGKYKHKKSYWKDKKNALEKEAFAHFYEATIRNDDEKLKIIKDVFPEAYKIFEDMLR